MRKLLVLVVLGAALTSTGLLRTWLDADAVALLSAELPSDGTYTQIAGEVLAEVTKNTKFEGKWGVNQDPSRDALTVFLFRSSDRTPAALAPYKRNCGFTGHRPIIFCDITIVDWLEDRWGFEARIVNSADAGTVFDPPCTNRSRCRFIFTWLLAHELGHVLGGHGPSNFAHGALDHYVSDASLSERRELEADSFASSRFGPPGMTQGKDLYVGLIDALNREIALPESFRSPFTLSPGTQTALAPSDARLLRLLSVNI